MAERTKAELIAEIAGLQAENESLKAAMEEKGEGDNSEVNAQLMEAGVALEAEKSAHAATQAKLADMEEKLEVARDAARRKPTEGKPQREDKPTAHTMTARAGFHPATVDDMPTVDQLNNDGRK